MSKFKEYVMEEKVLVEPMSELDFALQFKDKFATREHGGKTSGFRMLWQDQSNTWLSKEAFKVLIRDGGLREAQSKPKDHKDEKHSN